ncbi:YfhH family protein [Domibacillus robiginosus]|uniref:YfhH family protein n=1 Tax=Domibacillus robiginosus TaxID=1071054 RepID=UPI00067E2D3A|nr:YfhH family protein [Domibacillus robiginosus]
MEQEKRYSGMNETELKQEIARLREKARKAEQLGIVNEFAVYDRRVTMAQAYLMNPDDFEPGRLYELTTDPGQYFKVEYMNGVFAWGYRLNGDGREEGIPISLLNKGV